jgi:hypothetical protein
MAQEKDPAPIYLKIKGLGIHENNLKKNEIKVELSAKTRYLYNEGKLEINIKGLEDG